MKIEYRVIMQDEIDELQATVTDFLNDGWELAGNLVVNESEDPDTEAWYYQPIIRRQT